MDVITYPNVKVCLIFSCTAEPTTTQPNPTTTEATTTEPPTTEAATTQPEPTTTQPNPTTTEATTTEPPTTEAATTQPALPTVAPVTLQSLAGASTACKQKQTNTSQITNKACEFNSFQWHILTQRKIVINWNLMDKL